MRRTLSLTFASLALAFSAFGQDDLSTFKAEAVNAFVWGEDTRSGAISSSVRDPVTGTAIHKLNHGGIEVSSRAGFEKIAPGEAGEFLNFTTTVVNNTESELTVRNGGASVDGHVVLPLSVVLTKKGLSKKQCKQVWELSKMQCFVNGFLPNEDASSLSTPSKVFTLASQKALTVSFVTKDPRDYSVLCSMEGCYPKGTIRFVVVVNAIDFVFIWPGRAMVDCGR